MFHPLRPLGRLLWHAYAALVILLLLFWGGATLYHSIFAQRDIMYLKSEDNGGVVVQTENQDEKICINTAAVYPLRQLGFSYYEICMILYFRQCGFVFDSLPDLLCINHLDTAKINELSDRLSFEHEGDAENIRNRNSRPDRDWKKNLAWQKDNYEKHPRLGRAIPLFLADSVEMAAAGMNMKAWDTLSRYQRTHILRGSMTIDSLAMLSPENLGKLLSARSAGLRWTENSAKKEQEKTNINSTIVELNSATKEQLMTLPYVAERSAEGIIELRKRLGGFVETAQLLEVWAIDSSRYEKMKNHIAIDTLLVKKINVNSSNDTRLRRHPYFSTAIANKIWQIRMQKKKGEKLDEKDIAEVIEGESISPYFWQYVAYSR